MHSTCSPTPDTRCLVDMLLVYDLQMSQGVRGKGQMLRTVVARNTSLLQCLSALCLPEVINGVHCPRYLGSYPHHPWLAVCCQLVDIVGIATFYLQYLRSYILPARGCEAGNA